MMKLKDKKGIIAIKSALVEIDGLHLEYTLLSVGGWLRPVYAIEINDRYDRRMSFFGFNKKRAVSIFKSIVENTVTPCTLEDIAEDMAK